jgi:hypothetical protein
MKLFNKLLRTRDNQCGNGRLVRLVHVVSLVYSRVREDLFARDVHCR